MNKLFGFFKQKIIEVKDQNKQQFQNLAQALNENDYSKDRVLGMLQSAKTNYMSWNILIANQASTGLYFSQIHNRNICLKKVKGNKQLVANVENNKIKLEQMKKTHEQLQQIGTLNGKWNQNVNNNIGQMFHSLNIIQKNKAKLTQKQTHKKINKNKSREKQMDNGKIVTSQEQFNVATSEKRNTQQNKKEKKIIKTEEQKSQKQTKFEEIEDNDIQ